jgi:hypothetical protein
MRVFGRSEQVPNATLVMDAVAALARSAHVMGELDSAEWYQLAIHLSEQETPIFLERFHRTDEGIRGELQAWAAWLETCDYSPNHEPLMTHMIETQQVFTVRKPIDCANEVLVDNVCVAICQFLAQAADGNYQIDGKGFFAPDGTMLLQEF